MKEKKTNIRSFRYSDRVAEILEASEGNTLNEKFENLVLFCYDELPKIKSDLEFFKGLVKDEKNKYYRLERLNRTFDEVMRDLEYAKGRLDMIVESDNM